MNELALFAGAGGGILGGKMLKWRTVCAVEWDSYAASILVARQNDKTLDPFPVWDDVQTFDGRPWRGRVDVISGGFPCQDISCAGKGAGIDGERSGMWGHMARIVSEVRPEYVFVENSPMLVGRGLTRVISDLAKMGYDARWGIVGAHHVAAPHKRDRIWIVATNAKSARAWENEPRIWGLSERCSQGAEGVGQKDVADSKSGRGRGIRDCEGTQGTLSGSPAQPVGSGSAQSDVADSETKGLQGNQCPRGSDSQGWQKPDGSTTECGGISRFEVRNTTGAGLERAERSQHEGKREGFAEPTRGGWWATEPNVGRVAHGVANRVDRLKCIGNGQVPHVAAYAWQLLGGPIK